MAGLFLQAATNFAEALTDNTIAGGLLAFIVGFFILFLIFGIAIYIYSSLAFVKIARKAKTEPVWLAWIPIVGKPLLASKIAKMHWWPILLLLAYSLIFIPFGIILIWIGMLAFTVFWYIWMWKTFEAVKKPGWWILLSLIPFAGGIIFLVLLGIAAWGEGKVTPIKKVRK